MITEPEFRSSVPVRHQKELLDAYHKYVKEKSVFQYGRDIRQVLVDWVSEGNNPFTSNRYGFYSTAAQQYLDFLSGEWKACQIFEIMSGSRPPAVCALNQYGEPAPHSWDSEDDWPKPPSTKYFRYAAELQGEIIKFLTNRGSHS